VIRMPEHTARSAAVACVPLQLLAYHTACARGTDVDKPRNLAKSVTVDDRASATESQSRAAVPSSACR